MTVYAELQITSNFSFLRGGSHPEELVLRAAELGLSALALTDRNTLAGVVRAHIAAKEVGIRFVVGARLDLMWEENPAARSPAAAAESPDLQSPAANADSEMSSAAVVRFDPKARLARPQPNDVVSDRSVGSPAEPREYGEVVPPWGLPTDARHGRPDFESDGVFDLAPFERPSLTLLRGFAQPRVIGKALEQIDAGDRADPSSATPQ